MTMLTQPDTVYGLAASGDHLYAARFSGLYRSLDGGHTWQEALSSLERLEPLTITAAATDGEASIFAGTKGAVLRSTDRGSSWQIVGLASPPPNVTALALSPHYREDGLIAAATAEDGMFISTDRGANWLPWNFGLFDLHIYALAFSLNFAADRTIFAGTESGLFRSHNGGRAWRDVAFPLEAAPVLSLSWSAQRLFAGTENGGLLVSDDNGVNWQPNYPTGTVNALHTSGSRGWMLLEDQLLTSQDGGISWQAVSSLIPAHQLAMALLVTDSGQVLVGCADGTILSAGS